MGVCTWRQEERATGLRGRRGKGVCYHLPASSSVTEQACVP